MNIYDLGTDVKIGTDPAQPFKKNGTPTDPDVVAVIVRKPAPDNTVLRYVYGTDSELIRDGVGAYHAVVVGDVAETWRYRIKGSGNLNASAQGAFHVNADDLI